MKTEEQIKRMVKFLEEKADGLSHIVQVLLEQEKKLGNDEVIMELSTQNFAMCDAYAKIQALEWVLEKEVRSNVEHSVKRKTGKYP